MDQYEACMDAARLGWYLTTGLGDELIATNPTQNNEFWIFSEGEWTNKDGEVRDMIPPCEHLPIEDFHADNVVIE